MMTERKVTLEEVLAKRTPRGSFTRKQIEAWGVEWPPGRGWVKRLTGDPNAKVPMPGRTPVAIDMARKTRIQLEQEVVDLNAEVARLRQRIAELEERGVIW